MSTLNLENQFGEVSKNQILPSSSGVPLPAQASGTVVANLTGSSAQPSAVTLQALSTKLPAKAQITAISALATPVSPITIALSTSNTYSDAAVNTAVNAALTTAVADLQAQLTQMNAILSALKQVV